MTEYNSLEQIRLQKIAELRAEGIEPFPTRAQRTHTTAEAIAEFEAAEKSAGHHAEVQGRLVHGHRQGSRLLVIGSQQRIGRRGIERRAVLEKPDHLRAPVDESGLLRRDLAQRIQVERAGHQVVAIEPSRSMRRHGQHLHQDDRIHWLDDRLPALPATLRLGFAADVHVCGELDTVPAVPRLDGNVLRLRTNEEKKEPAR